MGKIISIVGLGPGDPKHVTLQAWEELTRSEVVFLRTRHHPVADALPASIQVNSFDDLYECADQFSEVYETIVDRLFEALHEKGKVVYGVPGDPSVGEATVAGLRARCEKQNIEITIIPGVSFIEPCLALLGIDALDGLSIVDALDLADAHHPLFHPDHPALVAQIYSKLVASDVKLTLLNQYADEHPVALIHQGGTQEVEIENLRLFEIDRSEKIGHMTTLYIPALPVSSSMESFQETVAHLRAPDGCPWDREQTHESLRMHVLEESYEVLHALDTSDIQALEEELGDLLLQIVLQAQIATEAGEFTMADVIRGINTKIINRHPHVFEDLDLPQVDQVLHNWEVLKAAEREAEGNHKGLLDGVPMGLPALAQANELQSRVVRVGFDWGRIDDVITKIHEELEEVQNAPDQSTRRAEVGDLLFTVVNYARWLDVDPEAALRSANQRFRKRFWELEKHASSMNRKLSDMTLEEMDSIWEGIKRDEGGTLAQ